MSRPDNQVNELHLRDPKPGDFWHEHFCPYHIVLAVTPVGVVIADKTRPDGDSHYTFDLESAREITHEEHAKAVRYSSGNGFAADVVPVRAALSVREWKSAGSKYIAIAEQKAAPHAGEALMDTNKMRDISREQFEEWYSAIVCCDIDVLRDSRTSEGGEGFPYRINGPDGEADFEVSEPASIAWLAWKASREAAVMELPGTEWFGEYSQEAVSVMRDGCAEAIEAQGLKVEVKP
ncbi:hypothetical protein [Pseudomonas monteilii]|uniref:hypothetical protein n=1 Tax=Pseudomonas monteilii TaxID=76759 RepID=UPI0018AAACC3|nr:hypothetical protein [Pseudomonas monteilii]MBF8746878.1 hypothetical protein [Pseudomonas monteilii]